jgi:Ca2+/Na+ antiporter
MESIPSWLVLIALVFFAPFIALPTRPKFLFLFIWPAWLCAYVVVLAKIYKNKAPIPTFGRWVEYERRRVFYQLAFVVLLLVGLFVALAAFVIQGSRSFM